MGFFPKNDLHKLSMFVLLDCRTGSLDLHCIAFFFPETVVLIKQNASILKPFLNAWVSTSIHMCWSGLEWNLFNSTPIHFNTCGLRWRHAHPNKALSNIITHCLLDKTTNASFYIELDYHFVCERVPLSCWILDWFRSYNKYDLSIQSVYLG
jgi:hypothetical protein